ncbi:MAG: hypothetical protein P2A85_15590 [Microcoleus anatoxicus]|uniref:hypothetical protein n=1 Tax=Microcoleus anatoxicus TaxID=2705319 RepID=UPI0036720E55
MAGQFEFIESNLYIGLSELDGDGHYFIMTREETSTEEALPNRENIYIELDDQCWGGNGGIDLIALSREKFTIYLNVPMAPIIGFDEIQITFLIDDDSEFQEFRKVLQEIMRGYEDRLNLID